jgi:hypothetical protein
MEQVNQENENQRFESDTQKIIRRHLADENDQITDDDIRNVRVGLVPPTEERVEIEEENKETENSEDKEGSDEPITPWDTVKE